MKDKEVVRLIKAETERQKKQVHLIASENSVSEDVRAALGSPFVNKYAEGYPNARYYAGNEVADKLETLCQKRALALFNLSPKEWAVNVQALSGAQANLAILTALVPFGSTQDRPFGRKIMGLSLAHGGHLSHGHKVSLSGKLWQSVVYEVDAKTEVLDYAAVAALAKKEKPNLIIAGYTAYPRRVDYKKFRALADACGALLLVDMSHTAGLVAGKALPSPFPYADAVMTTTHKTLRGPRSALIFSRTAHSAAIDKAVFPGMQGGPHMNQIAAVAVALKEAASPGYKKYAAQVVKNAKALGESLVKEGFRLVSGGTDTHLLLVDTWKNGTGIGGGEAAERLERAGIIVNKNTIPFDTRSPRDPSGIRLGTAWETTRGKKEKDMEVLGKKIAKVLHA